MPPNRKGNFDTVDNLATLNVSSFVQAKFQPLTTTPSAASPKASNVASAEAVEPAVPHPQQPQDDPAKQALINRILLEERLREQFSANHMIQAEQHVVAEQKTDIHREETKSDDYWAMDTPKDLGSKDVQYAKRSDPSYWDFPTKSNQQKKDDLIHAILEQERVRQLFTVDHMVLKIQEEAAALQKKETTSQPTKDSDSYWAWNAEVLKDQNMQGDKEEVIQHILEAEKLRQQFSIEALGAKLTQEAKASEPCPSRAIAANDDYWAGF